MSDQHLQLSSSGHLKLHSSGHLTLKVDSMVLSANLSVAKRVCGLSTWHDGDKYNWQYEDDVLQATSSTITTFPSSWVQLGVTSQSYFYGDNSVPPFPVDQNRLYVEAAFRAVDANTAELRFFLGSTRWDGVYRYYGELDTFQYGEGSHNISYTYLAAVVSGTFTVTK